MRSVKMVSGTAATIQREYTPEEFLNSPDTHFFDLIDGEFVERKVGALSSQVGMNFAIHFGIYAQSRGGTIQGPDGGLAIFPARPNSVLFPDAAFYTKGRIPGDRSPSGWISEIPDVLVEVVSPNDTSDEVEKKVQVWLDAGVPTVWVAWPELARIRVYKLGSMVNVHGDDLLTDERLPGFSVPASAFFP
jgi:Uma2 family endonuclease